MTQVATIINDALGILRVLDPNEAPEAEDAASAIRALNLMMRAWEVDGLSLGWSDVSSPADTLPAPPEAEEAMTYHLAIRLRARYGAALEPDVVQLATDGLATLRAQVMANSFDRLTYPDLPAGAARRGGSYSDGING